MAPQVDLLNSDYSTNRFAFSFSWWSAFNWKKWVAPDDKNQEQRCGDMKYIDQQDVYDQVLLAPTHGFCFDWHHLLNVLFCAPTEHVRADRPHVDRGFDGRECCGDVCLWVERVSTYLRVLSPSTRLICLLTALLNVCCSMVVGSFLVVGTLTVLLPDLARLTLSSDPMQQMHRRLGSSTLHLRSVGGESCQSE